MNHEFPPKVGPSNAMGPLVGKCKRCGNECCHCKTCVLAKDGVFNVCAECRRRLVALHGGYWKEKIDGLSTE
jgi:hypothetical protein